MKRGGGKNKGKEINKKEGNILENGMKCTSCIIFFCAGGINRTGG